jgi:hypothetical protein
MSHDDWRIAAQAPFYVMFVLLEDYTLENNCAQFPLYEKAYEEHVD